MIEDYNSVHTSAPQTPKDIEQQPKKNKLNANSAPGHHK